MNETSLKAIQIRRRTDRLRKEIQHYKVSNNRLERIHASML